MTYFLNPTKTPHSFLERAFRLSLNVFTHLRGLLSAVTSVAFSHLCSFCIKNSKRTWCECSLNQGWVCEYREDDSCTACWDYSNMLLEYSPVSKAIQSRTGERDGFFFYLQCEQNTEVQVLFWINSSSWEYVAETEAKTQQRDTRPPLNDYYVDYRDIQSNQKETQTATVRHQNVKWLKWEATAKKHKMTTNSVATVWRL